MSAKITNGPMLPYGMNWNGSYLTITGSILMYAPLWVDEIKGLTAARVFCSVPFKCQSYTTVNKLLIAAETGEIVFDSTLGKLCVYTGAQWETIVSAP